MAELFHPPLVECVFELERDLLAKRRQYANRTFTRRLTMPKAERRLAILQEIIRLLREQLTEGELTFIEEHKERLAARRKARAKAKGQVVAHG